MNGLTGKRAAVLRKREGFRQVYAALRAGKLSQRNVASFYGVAASFVSQVAKLVAWEKARARGGVK